MVTFVKNEPNEKIIEEQKIITFIIRLNLRNYSNESKFRYVN